MHPNLRSDTPGHAQAVSPITSMGDHTASPNQLPAPPSLAGMPASGRSPTPATNHGPGKARY